MFTNNTALRRLFARWTDTAEPIPRRVYVVHGCVLATVKYVGDAVLTYLATGGPLAPWDYARGLPALLALSMSTGGAPVWLPTAFVLWMLPFVALGLTLTMRRAIDAGKSPWLAILFLVPYANYALIAVLSVLPTRTRSQPRQRSPSSSMPDAAAACLAIASGVTIVLLAVALGVSTLRRNGYGVWLFVLTPFAMGATAAFVYNRGSEVRDGQNLVILGALATANVAMLFTLLEGAICLLMAMPLAVPLALLGGVVGRRAATAGHSPSASSALFMLLALPVTAVVEPPSGRVEHEVRSAVVINARPDAVWPHVVAFSELPPPTEWVFRTGIAYPIRARIEGQGVGAVRYCEFSTGAFVEPITRWEPGVRLSFDVTASPPSMRELSPFGEIAPRHLHGYLRSKRGEFRFVDLGDGRTRLEGSTWYELEFAPEAYWRVFSDVLIHRIHGRVLDHIKREVEGA